MFRRFMVAAFLSALLCVIIGCAGIGPSKTLINGNNIPQLSFAKIINVTLTNGRVIEFDDNGGRFHERYGLRRDVIVGRILQGENVTIALNNVQKAYIEDVGAEAENSRLFFPTFFVMGILVAAIL